MKTKIVLIAALFVAMTGIAFADTNVTPNVGGDTAKNGWHPSGLDRLNPGHSPQQLGGDVFYIPAMKIFAHGNFPTTKDQLASGDENPLGSVTPNFGVAGPYMGAKF